MRCSSCNFDNAAGKKFCIRCGVAFGVRCPKCGTENPPEASFCGDCGAGLLGIEVAHQLGANQTISLARELGDAMSAAFALGMKAAVHRMMQEAQPALETAKAAMSEAEELGFLHVLHYTAIMKGWALTELGRADEGLALTREHIEALSASRPEHFLTLHMATLADACLSAGRIEQGLKAIGEALDLVRRSGECFWAAEIHRIRGELLLHQSPSDPALARASVEHAIEVARQQGAKSLELRAACSLARILRESARRDEARAMLAEIYKWFTEGFDMRDLVDAKVLLEELQARPVLGEQR